MRFAWNGVCSKRDAARKGRRAKYPWPSYPDGRDNHAVQDVGIVRCVPSLALCRDMLGQECGGDIGHGRRLSVLGFFLLRVLTDLRLERSLSAILRASSGVNSCAFPMVTRLVTARRPPSALLYSNTQDLAPGEYAQAETANLSVEDGVAAEAVRPVHYVLGKLYLDAVRSPIPRPFFCQGLTGASPKVKCPRHMRKEHSGKPTRYQRLSRVWVKRQETCGEF